MVYGRERVQAGGDGFPQESFVDFKGKRRRMSVPDAVRAL